MTSPAMYSVSARPNVSRARRPACFTAGFTLFELVLALGLFAAIITAAVPFYSRFHNSAQLITETDELIQTLNTARTHAGARLRDTPHGVRLTASGYTLFEGASYASRTSAYDREETLPGGLSLSHTVSGGEVVFSRQLAAPSATGTITLTHDTYGTTTITITPLGSIRRE